MEQILYSNQAIKFYNGIMSDSIDSGERKLIFNYSNDENCSLLVYNLYTMPHEIIRGIRQARVIKKGKDYLELQGYGVSSNGLPNKDIMLKIKFCNQEIESVEYINLVNNASLLHNKRLSRCNDFFFNLFNHQNIVPPNLTNEYFESLNDIYASFFHDIKIIKEYKNSVEFSVSGSIMLAMAKYQRIRIDVNLYFNTCLIGFSLLYQSYRLEGDIAELVKLIRFVNNNCDMFLAIISIKLLKNNQNSKLLPFSNLPEMERAKMIFWMMESWCIFLEDKPYYISPLVDVVAFNKKLFLNNVLEPYKIDNSLETIKYIYELLNESIN